MRRLLQAVQVAVVVAIAGAAVYGLVDDAMGGGGSAGFNLPTRVGVGKVADTLSTTAIAPGEIDTTSGVYTTGCSRLLLTGFYDGDSVAYYVDYSPNNVDWLNYRDSTFVNSTPTADSVWFTWAAPDTAWITDSTWSAITRDRIDGTPTLKVWHQFQHAATVSGIDTTIHFSDFMFDWVRLRIWNIDVADTMRSNTWSIRCEN